MFQGKVLPLQHITGIHLSVDTISHHVKKGESSMAY